MALDVESFYERYGPMVLRRCRALLRSDAQAQDGLQDVFVTLIRHQDRLADETATAGLLLRIATNVCLNRLRSQRRRPEDLVDQHLLQIAATGAGPSAEGRSLARDLLSRLFRADDPLAASSQTIAVLHLVDGMTLEEVAREVGLSVSGVRKRIRTLRARLSRLEGALPA